MMKNSSILLTAVAVLVAILPWSTAEPNTYNLTVGPKKDETGRFLYRGSFQPEHCYWCPLQFLEDSSFEKKQQPLCFNKFDKYRANLTDYEKQHKKYAVCTTGEPPGCRALPNHTKSDLEFWHCDPGYSLWNYSVYFSCGLICNRSKKVIAEYYCNESLQWELTFKMSPSDCEQPIVAVSKDSIPAIIGGVVGSVLFILIVVLLCFLYRRHKWKKKSQSPSQGSSGEGEIEMEVRGQVDEENVGSSEERSVDSNQNVCNEHGNERQEDRQTDEGDSLRSSAEFQQASNITENTGKTSVASISSSTAKPTIKIISWKNNTSQQSVPIQGGFYSVEIGSDIIVRPDCESRVFEFIVNCKNRRAFRGKACDAFDGKAYIIEKIVLEDADTYGWSMRLENGHEHNGTFVLYVNLPETVTSSEYRMQPVGGEVNTDININQVPTNQQIRAEVHQEQLRFVSLGDSIYSNNNPRHHQGQGRADSGLSLGSLRSSAVSGGVMPIIRDQEPSTSGYGTHPSYERDREEIIGAHPTLNPSTISNEYSGSANGARDLNERPDPPGCTDEHANAENIRRRYDDDDDDDDDYGGGGEHQTFRKQHWTENENDALLGAENQERNPYGESENTYLLKPVGNLTQAEDVPNVDHEGFLSRVKDALKKFPSRNTPALESNTAGGEMDEDNAVLVDERNNSCLHMNRDDFRIPIEDNDASRDDNHVVLSIPEDTIDSGLPTGENDLRISIGENDHDSSHSRDKNDRHEIKDDVETDPLIKVERDTEPNNNDTQKTSSDVDCNSSTCKSEANPTEVRCELRSTSHSCESIDSTSGGDSESMKYEADS